MDQIKKSRGRPKKSVINPVADFIGDIVGAVADVVADEVVKEVEKEVQPVVEQVKPILLHPAFRHRSLHKRKH